MKLSKMESVKKGIAIVVTLGLLFPSPAYSARTLGTARSDARFDLTADLLKFAGVGRSELRVSLEASAGDISALLDRLSGVVEVTPEKTVVTDPSRLKNEVVDYLVAEAALSLNPDVKAAAQRIIRETGLALGIKEASIHNFYMARQSGKWSNLTTPAYNVRVSAYETMRQILRAAIDDQTGVVLLELAKSEKRYTGQSLAEYTAMGYAAAIKEGYRGLLFFQGDHYQVDKKTYFTGTTEEEKAASREKALKDIEKLIREALEAGKRNIDVDPSTLVDDETLEEILALERQFTTRYIEERSKVDPLFAEDEVRGGLKEKAEEEADDIWSLRRKLVDDLEIGLDIPEYKKTLTREEVQYLKPFNPSKKQFGLTREEKNQLQKLYEKMHRYSFEVTMHFIRFIRKLEKEMGLNTPISIGVEERHIDNKKHAKFPSTVLGSITIMRQVIDQSKKEGLTIPSKLALQTGAMHGLGGKVDWGIFERHQLARRQIGVSVFVQHGTSTLNADDFQNMPRVGSGEAHLATEYQKISLGVIGRLVPDLREQMTAFLEALIYPERPVTPEVEARLKVGGLLDVEKRKKDYESKFRAKWEQAFAQPGKSREAVLVEIFGDELPGSLKGSLKDLAKELSGPFKREIWALSADVVNEANRILYKEFRRINQAQRVTNSRNLATILLPFGKQNVVLPPRPAALEAAVAARIESRAEVRVDAPYVERENIHESYRRIIENAETKIKELSGKPFSLHVSGLFERRGEIESNEEKVLQLLTSEEYLTRLAQQIKGYDGEIKPTGILFFYEWDDDQFYFDVQLPNKKWTKGYIRPVIDDSGLILVTTDYASVDQVFQEIVTLLSSRSELRQLQQAIDEINAWQAQNQAIMHERHPDNPFRTHFLLAVKEIYEKHRLYELTPAERLKYVDAAFDPENFPKVHSTLHSILKRVDFNPQHAVAAMNPGQYYQLGQILSDIEETHTFYENRLIRTALNRIFDFWDREKRILELNHLVDEIDIELEQPGHGNLPLIAAMQDLHGGSQRAASLVGFVLGLDANVYEKLASFDAQGLVERLKLLLTRSGIRIEDAPVRFIGLNDKYDRGDDPIGVFELVKWLNDNRKAKPFLGNHDLWRMIAVLGTHHYFASQGLDFEAKEVKGDHIAHWAREAFEHTGWGDIELDQVNQRRFNNSLNVVNEILQNRSLKTLEPINLMALRQNFEKELKEAKSHNAKVRASVQAKDGKYTDEDYLELPNIFEQTLGALRRLKETYNTRIQDMNKENTLDIPGIDFQEVNLDNFWKDSEIIDRALWELNNSRLFHIDILGNLHHHNIIPFDEANGGYDVEYLGVKGLPALELMEEDLISFGERRDTLAASSQAFRKMAWERIGAALTVINSWYSDLNPVAKAPAVRKFITSGGLPALGRGILGENTRLYTEREANFLVFWGHNEIKKFNDPKVNLPYFYPYPDQGTALVNIDYEMSRGYSDQGAVVTLLKRDANGKVTGLRRWGYRPHSSIVEDLTFEGTEALDQKQRSFLEMLADGEKFLRWYRVRALNQIKSDALRLEGEAHEKGRQAKKTYFSGIIADADRQLLENNGRRESLIQPASATKMADPSANFGGRSEARAFGPGPEYKIRTEREQNEYFENKRRHDERENEKLALIWLEQQRENKKRENAWLEQTEKDKKAALFALSRILHRSGWLIDKDDPVTGIQGLDYYELGKTYEEMAALSESEYERKRNIALDIIVDRSRRLAQNDWKEGAGQVEFLTIQDYLEIVRLARVLQMDLEPFRSNLIQSVRSEARALTLDQLKQFIESATKVEGVDLTDRERKELPTGRYDRKYIIFGKDLDGTVTIRDTDSDFVENISVVFQDKSGRIVLQPTILTVKSQSNPSGLEVGALETIEPLIHDRARALPRAEARTEWSDEMPITPETKLQVGDYVRSYDGFAGGVILKIRDGGLINLSSPPPLGFRTYTDRDKLNGGRYRRPLSAELTLVQDQPKQVGDYIITLKDILSEVSVRIKVEPASGRSESRMLVLLRERGESIIIGDNIKIVIVDIRGDKVRLGIEAPKEIPVHRQEVYEVIQRVNLRAQQEEEAEDERRKKEQGGEGPANRAETRFAGEDAELPDVLTPEQKTQFRGTLDSVFQFYQSENGQQVVGDIVTKVVGVTSPTDGVIFDLSLLPSEPMDSDLKSSDLKDALLIAFAVRLYFRNAPIAGVSDNNPVMHAYVDEINRYLQQEHMQPFIVEYAESATVEAAREAVAVAKRRLQEKRATDIKGILGQAGSIVAEAIRREIKEAQIIAQQKLQGLIAQHPALAGLATQLQHYFALVQSA